LPVAQPPKFSVVIPTQERADTLEYALQTAVDQTFEDVEIVVHESGDDRRTSRIVRKVGDHRTRHLKTVLPVSMTENWERALASANGDYITFIGDDDGLLSDACATASKILSRIDSEIVTWHPVAYYWPQHIVTEHRNLLKAYLEDLHVLEKV
jgi:glycosyltransferase involved in cell wall biosynthesis